MYNYFKIEKQHVYLENVLIIFSNASDNNEMAANLWEKFLKKARVPNSKKIRKWCDQLVRRSQKKKILLTLILKKS